MNKELEKKLKATLRKLEAAQGEIQKTQGYTLEAEKIKLLEILVSEQLNHKVTHEDTGYTAR
jgi:hypothetical protein